MKEKHISCKVNQSAATQEKLFLPAIQTLIQKDDFRNLEFFRSQVDIKEKILDKQPYSRMKPKWSVYKNVFINLGLIYLILSFVLFWKGIFVSPISILQNNFKVHPIIPFFCFLSALYCLATGIRMSPPVESIKKTYRKAKRALKYCYQKQRLRFDSGYSFGSYRNTPPYSILPCFYEAALEQLFAEKTKALSLADKISASAELSPEKKEELYNELLLELREQMFQIVQEFETLEYSALRAV